MNYELQDPRAIKVGTTTEQLLTEVSSAVAELNVLRPLSPELAARLREALLPDRVVATLNMEGIVATRRQTLAVMDAMRIQESVGAGETEIYNALRADEFVNDSVDRGLVISESFLREINSILLDKLREDAGRFRLGDVKLSGASFTPPPGPAVPSLTRQLLELFPATNYAGRLAARPVHLRAPVQRRQREGWPTSPRLGVSEARILAGRSPHRKT